MIKVIAFDFSGVIINQPLREWFEQHNLDKNIYRSITKKWDLGEIDENESFELLSPHTGISKDKLYEVIYKKVIFNQNIISLIHKLKRRYKIAMFSNNIASIVRKMLAENNFLDLFDEIIISSEHGLIKPDKAYYNKMLSILGVKANEVIFTDDKQEFVDGGENAGIKSVLFTDAKFLEKELRSLGVQV